MLLNINELKESNEFLNILTESLNSAVFIVDREIRVQSLNGQCDIMFNKSAEKMIEEICGNALGCEFTNGNSIECGQSENCMDCTLRNSIVKAFARKIPTDKEYLRRSFQGDKGLIEKCFLFSTKYIQYNRQEMVLIIIDDVTSFEAQKKELEIINQELLNKEKIIHSNLEMARNIQMEMIPKNISDDGLFNACGLYLPVDELGGDYYDMNYHHSKRLSFFISDVSGHGASSALIATLQKPLISGYFSNLNITPGEVLANLNQSIYRFLGKEGFFLTAIYGWIDFMKMTLEYSIAAHPDIIILRNMDDTIVQLPDSKKDFLIGPFLNNEYHTHSEKIYKGDIIILYTDGILETVDKNNQLYGKERFLPLLHSSRSLGPEGIIDSVLKSVRIFSQNKNREDDFTMLIIEIK